MQRGHSRLFYVDFLIYVLLFRVAVILLRSVEIGNDLGMLATVSETGRLHMFTTHEILDLLQVLQASTVVSIERLFSVSYYIVFNLHSLYFFCTAVFAATYVKIVHIVNKVQENKNSMHITTCNEQNVL